MINQKIKVLLNTILVLIVIIMPFISFGEIGGVLTDGDVTVSTIPKNPQPYQNVTIELNSYATDLNKANIQWKDKTGVLLSGYGEKKYSFTTQGPNTISVIDVYIEPSDSIVVLNKRITIVPSEVDILWESVDGYIPPFYKGKSFIATSGIIKAVAIPNTISGSKGDITYSWKRDGSAVLGTSGYNKNSYTFQNSEFNPTEKIEVSASSVAGNYNATKTIEIPTIKPKIIFYKKSPTDGILYNQALLNDYFLKDDEITIKAVPYFFSTKGYLDSELSYSWKINNENIATPSKKTEITVRPSSRGGTATISLILENLYLLFQKTGNEIKVNL